jgi:hypothetical protein
MARRLDLQVKLVEILGSSYVYFNPPENVKMQYPCIVYTQDSEEVRHANDRRYGTHKRYLITVIDHDPDSPIAEAVSELPMCSFNRAYAADNLKHFVYQLFF